MTKTYQSLEGELSVRGAATITRTGQTNAVAIVGGYDASNAASEVTAGEPTLITDPTNAASQFGDSEIARAAAVVSANGVGTMYGVPVPETETTESIASGQSITLSNTPLFNPDLHPDHSITVTDTDTSTDLSVNVVYDDAPSTPSEEDTANVNPINGKVEIDASGNYDITYTYGDYSDAIDNAADLNVRDVLVGTEDGGIKATVNTTLSDIANDFDFKRGITNAAPEIGATEISNYTPDEQDWRIVEVAPAIAEGADGPVRTCFAVGGFIAAQPIGPDGSTLYDVVSGLTSLNTEYRPSEVNGFDGVTALTRNGVVGKAETTSTEEQFRLIYAAEIIDNVALGLFSTARDYAGGPQDLTDLEALLETVCQRKSQGSPPLLGFGDGRNDDPYDVNVQFGSTNDVAEAAVSIVPYPIAETVNLSMVVTDGYVEFDGAS